MPQDPKNPKNPKNPKDKKSPKTEKLKLIKFPCDYPIKVFSNSHFDLETFATAIIHKHAPKMEFIPISKNISTKGNYQSITITLRATSKKQLAAIFKDLSANKEVIMVL